MSHFYDTQAWIPKNITFVNKAAFDTLDKPTQAALGRLVAAGARIFRTDLDGTQEYSSTDSAVLLAGDMGCLLNMSGRLLRENTKIEVRHIAEVLAGTTQDVPPIGKPSAAS